MTEPHSVTRVVTGAPEKTLTFETGKLAGQAGGAVTVQLGDTVVLVTATAAKPVPETAPTSSRSPSTSKSACTPPARSPARSSAVRASPATRPS